MKKIEKPEVKYNKRVWLNPSSSESSGSLVAFNGKRKSRQESKNINITCRFLEISDCCGKIRIHQCWEDSKEDFITKLKLMNKEINEFIVHLTKKDNDDTYL